MCGVVQQGCGATGVWCHRGVVPPREQRLASTLSTLLRQAGMSCVSVSTTKSYILLWPGFGSYFLKVNASKLQGTGNECTHTHTTVAGLTQGLKGPSSAKQGASGPMYRLSASPAPLANLYLRWAPETLMLWRCSGHSSRSLHSRRGFRRYLVALGAPTLQHSTAMSHERQQSKLLITYTDCRLLSSALQVLLDAFGAREGGLSEQ